MDEIEKSIIGRMLHHEEMTKEARTALRTEKGELIVTKTFYRILHIIFIFRL
jgi:hypothetical protein